jgi:hypothetical protein
MSIPIGTQFPFKSRPTRRRNLSKGRNKSVSWTPFHAQLVDECLALWPLPISKRSRESLVVTTSLSFFRAYLEWLETTKKDLPEEFYQSTPFAESIKWFKQLKGQAYEKDAAKVLGDAYGKTD